MPKTKTKPKRTTLQDGMKLVQMFTAIRNKQHAEFNQCLPKPFEMINLDGDKCGVFVLDDGVMISRKMKDGTFSFESRQFFSNQIIDMLKRATTRKK